jgi:glycosyltransferase involved in cell wall biosynthesis
MVSSATATVSVVICAYTEDRWNDLVASVTSVLQESPEELVVVIDHNPGLLARLRAHLVNQQSTSRVIVVPNSSTKGLSGARNTGVAACTCDLVLFLDDDATALPGWLRAHREAFADTTHGTVVGTAGAVQPAYEVRPPTWWPDEFNWVVGCSYEGLATAAVPVRNPIGANMGFKRSVLVESGGFDEHLGRIGKRPTGCEETELAIRATSVDSSRIVIQVPDARALHRVPRSRLTFRYFRSRCYAEGISKATVARLSGAHSGLSSERTYAARTLPAGFARALLRDRRPRRAAAMVIGLLLAGAGYVRGWLSPRRRA